MPKPIKCPQCGASEANLLQNDIYQCKFCGSIYEFGDVKDDFENPYSNINHLSKTFLQQHQRTHRVL